MPALHSLESLFARVQKPARYTGGEWNSIVKDWDEVTPERMKTWVDTFRGQIDGPIPALLYTKYWLDAMRAHAKARA